MNTKHIAIALVLVILIAGIAVAVPLLNDSDDSKNTTDSNTEGRLMIYGNANLDDYLDKKDVNYIKDVIDGKAKETKYTDANQDGKVDQKDVEFVEKMVKREPMKIWFWDVYDKKPYQIQYPIVKIAAANGEVLEAVKILGKQSNLTAHTMITDWTLYSDIDKDIPTIGSRPNKGPLPIEVLSQIEMDALVTLPSDSYVTNQQELEASGIPVVRLGLAWADPSPAYITFGYMIQAEQRAMDYVEFIDGVLKKIDDTVSDHITDDKRVRGIVLGYAVQYGNISDFGVLIEQAGGINACNWFEHRYTRDGFEWLYNYDFDWIVGSANPAGYDMYQTPDYPAKIRNIWDQHTDIYKMTDAYLQGHMAINESNMPNVIKAAYLAVSFYPEFFDADFADNVHQYWVDHFCDNLHQQGYDVSKDGLFQLNFETVKPFY